jgi:hypothetical protein
MLGTLVCRMVRDVDTLIAAFQPLEGRQHHDHGKFGGEGRIH